MSAHIFANRIDEKFLHEKVAYIGKHEITGKA